MELVQTPLLPVTVYTVLVDAPTVITLEVEPVFHTYDEAPEATRVALLPKQTEVGPLIARSGCG